MKRDQLEKLAQLVANRARTLNGERPALKVVGERAEGSLDDSARDAYIGMIRQIRQGYDISLGYFVNQAILEHGSLEQMPDEELIALHAKLERAVECIQWDIPYEDTGSMENYG